MKVAVVGFGNIRVDDLGKYLPADTTEIIAGITKGTDAIAKEFALKHSIRYTEVLPENNRYEIDDLLKRNVFIISNADIVIVLWDGKALGAAFAVKKCVELGTPYQVFTAK